MVQSNGKKIDHLSEDDPIPGQRFVCLSFVSPEGIRNCTTRGLKVRGVYQTYEEAQERCSELQAKDADFDIFIGEVGKWLPWDPDPNTAKDQKYQEDELQKLVDGYKKNLSKAQKLQEDRKRDMIQNAAKDEQTKLAKRKQRMRKKLEKKTAEKRMQNLVEKRQTDILPTGEEFDVPQKKTGGKKKKDISKEEKELESKDTVAKQERERLFENQQTIEKQQNTVDNIDDQLARIQSLYNKLNKKKEETGETG